MPVPVNDFSQTNETAGGSNTTTKDRLRNLLNVNTQGIEPSSSHRRSQKRKSLSTLLLLTTDRLSHEHNRVSELESRVAALLTLLQQLAQSRDRAITQASRLNEQVSAYKIQLERAQQEVFRAEDVIRRLDEEKRRAETDYTRSKDRVRTLLEQRSIDKARDDGFREGWERARIEADLMLDAAIQQRTDDDDVSIDSGYGEPMPAPSSQLRTRNRAHTTSSVAPPPRRTTPPQRPASTAPSLPTQAQFQARSGPTPTPAGHDSSPETIRPISTAPQRPPTSRHSTSASARRPSASSTRPRPPSRPSTTPGPPSPAHEDYRLPPDNYIPTSANDRIVLPPPHELSRPVSVRDLRRDLDRPSSQPALSGFPNGAGGISAPVPRTAPPPPSASVPPREFTTPIVQIPIPPPDVSQAPPPPGLPPSRPPTSSSLRGRLGVPFFPRTPATNTRSTAVTPEAVPGMTAPSISHSDAPEFPFPPQSSTMTGATAGSSQLFNPSPAFQQQQQPPVVPSHPGYQPNQQYHHHQAEPQSQLRPVRMYATTAPPSRRHPRPRVHSVATAASTTMSDYDILDRPYYRGHTTTTEGPPRSQQQRDGDPDRERSVERVEEWMKRGDTSDPMASGNRPRAGTYPGGEPRSFNGEQPTAGPLAQPSLSQPQVSDVLPVPSLPPGFQPAPVHDPMRPPPLYVPQNLQSNTSPPRSSRPGSPINWLRKAFKTRGRSHSSAHSVQIAVEPPSQPPSEGTLTGLPGQLILNPDNLTPEPQVLNSRTIQNYIDRDLSPRIRQRELEEIHAANPQLPAGFIPFTGSPGPPQARSPTPAQAADGGSPIVLLASPPGSPFLRAATPASAIIVPATSYVEAPIPPGVVYPDPLSRASGSALSSDRRVRERRGSMSTSGRERDKESGDRKGKGRLLSSRRRRGSIESQSTNATGALERRISLFDQD